MLVKLFKCNNSNISDIWDKAKPIKLIKNSNKALIITMLRVLVLDLLEAP